MIYRIYESFMMYVLWAIETIEKGFIRFYPYIAIGIALIVAIGTEEAYKNGNSVNLTIVIAIAWIITALLLLWFVMTSKKKTYEMRHAKQGGKYGARKTFRK